VKIINERGALDFKGVHILNAGDPMAIWLLYAYLPYDQLVVAPDELFASQWINPFLFLLGFVPQEYGITPAKMASFQSRLTPYFESGFGCWQPVHFEYRDMDSIPYLVPLAIQQNLPFNIWRFNGATQLDRVHWLNRRCLVLNYLTSVPISKRMALTISTYQTMIQTHFGPTLNQQSQQTQTNSDAPHLPSDIARKKFEDVAKLQQTLESESPSP
ncbi:MAG: hypothetical protein VW397_08075, partial [Candidatus Margulisiibacteriota bacterium]